MNTVLPQVEWSAAILILVKLIAAVVSWWKVEQAWADLLFWMSSTLTLIALAILLSTYVPPSRRGKVAYLLLATPLQPAFAFGTLCVHKPAQNAG